MKGIEKDWEIFELAIRNFVAALDPKAKVIHNAKLPDIDTGKPRQIDVWVEAKVCNLYPFKILISCKRWSRKISQQDVDAFIGELRSSGAHKGVIYSYKGFTKPAVEKAKKIGISCCKLYQNEVPDLPKSLIVSFYCSNSSYRLRINSESLNDWGEDTFSEIFSITDNKKKSSQTLLEKLDIAFQEEEKLTIKKALDNKLFPKSWQVAIKVTKPKYKELIVYLEGKFRIYRANIEGQLVSGHYSFTEDEFMGSFASPWIDTQSSEPGPNWELVTDPPDAMLSPSGHIVLGGSSCKEQLMERYNNVKLKNFSKH